MNDEQIGKMVLGFVTALHVDVVQGAIRALDGNPWDPREDPDLYRRWKAASAAADSPATVRIMDHTARGLPAARRSHALFEGIDR